MDGSGYAFPRESSSFQWCVPGFPRVICSSFAALPQRNYGAELACGRAVDVFDECDVSRDFRAEALRDAPAHPLFDGCPVRAAAATSLTVNRVGVTCVTWYCQTGSFPVNRVRMDCGCISFPDGNSIQSSVLPGGKESIGRVRPQGHGSGSIAARSPSR